MKCPQCNTTLIEPNGHEKYCDSCGFPDENRQVFTLIEVKAYLRSMFKKVNCADDIAIENNRLACAYNLLLDDTLGICVFCDEGKAEDISFNSFQHVPLD